MWPINPLLMTPGSNPFGVHPNMPGLQNLYENGNAAVVANVGPLVEQPAELLAARPRHIAGSPPVKLPLGHQGGGSAHAAIAG